MAANTPIGHSLAETKIEEHDHDPYRRGLWPVRICPYCNEGQWGVEVISGDIYLLDLDWHTVTRLSAPGLFRKVFDLSNRSLGAGQAKRYREDGRALRLVALDIVRADQPMNMLVDVRRDGIPTYRSTSRVTHVWCLPLPFADEWDEEDPL